LGVYQLEGKIKKRIVLVGSYRLEQMNGRYFAPRNYLDHWHHLTEFCDQIDFHAHVTNVDESQLCTPLDTTKIRVHSLQYLSKSYESRTWRDYIRDQKLIISHARDSVGVIESFPASGGMLSPLYYMKRSFRLILYLKVDWREQLLHREQQLSQKSLTAKLKMLYFGWSQDLAVRQADVVLARGRSLYEQYQKSAKYIELARPIASFSSEFAYERNDTCNGKIIHILYVGDLCKRKRPLDLLQATAIAKQLCPDKLFHLTFVGGEHKIEWETVSITSILSSAEELGLSEQVECVGRINDPIRLSEYYKQADIFILPSAAEGFPRAVNEAMLHSLPVIVTPVGGIPGELVEGEHALFIPVDSPYAIAISVERLIKNPLVRQQLIANGFELVTGQMKEPSFVQHARLLGV